MRSNFLAFDNAGKSMEEIQDTTAIEARTEGLYKHAGCAVLARDPLRSLRATWVVPKPNPHDNYAFVLQLGHRMLHMNIVC